MMSAPACVPGQIKVPIVEWDVEAFENLDNEPGAITVDVTSSSADPTRLWFVTRQSAPHLYRFVPGRGNANAQWRSWSLFPTGTAGGLKKVRPAKDNRHVFVRMPLALQRIDTQCTTSGSAACEAALTLYVDGTDGFMGTSDLAIDNFNNVYTASAVDGVAEDYIQKLNPNAPVNAAGEIFVERWQVGGGAGVCPSVNNDLPSEYTPCLAGLDLDNKNQHLVYFSAANSDEIGELNTKLAYQNVRYWSLTKLGDALKEDIRDPRQLRVEYEDGKAVVWVVTGSGHLVRLIPQSGKNALMSAHRMPDKENDPFGTAPDGEFIGYTAVSNPSDPMEPMADEEVDSRKDKVGVLSPKAKPVQIEGRIDTADKSDAPVGVQRTSTMTDSKAAKPDKKFAPGRVFRNEKGDVFVDAFINKAEPQKTVPSERPTGITPDYGSKVGTFFYAVGLSGDVPALIKRIGRVFLPPAERGKHARDDDDFDGDGKKNKYEDDDDDGDGTMNAADRDDDNDCKDDDFDDKDDDNDGHDDKWDDPRKKETRNSKDHTTGGGSSTTHQMVVPAGATLVVAQATAADPATPVKVEIVSPSGIKLASPLATPGVGIATLVAPAAGTYTVRVTNLGLAATTFTTDLIVQELWPALTAIVP